MKDYDSYAAAFGLLLGAVVSCGFGEFHGAGASVALAVGICVYGRFASSASSSRS